MFPAKVCNPCEMNRKRQSKASVLSKGPWSDCGPTGRGPVWEERAQSWPVSENFSGEGNGESPLVCTDFGVYCTMTGWGDKVSYLQPQVREMDAVL